jgi:FlaA1/EpsC-like NDP-sugar epimerase
MQPTSKTIAQATKPLPRARRVQRPAQRRALAIRLLHAALFSAAVAAAWGLSLALSATGHDAIAFPVLLATLVAAKAVSFELFRLHRASWRWFGLPDAAAITVANTSGSVLAALLLGPPIAEIAVAALLLIEWLISEGLLLGSHMLLRMLREAAGRAAGPTPRKRVLIYGAGRRGLSLLRQIRNNPATAYEIAGFIDDDPAKTHLMMQMTPVLGNGEDLPRLARLHGVGEVLIAVGSPSPDQRRRIREFAGFAGLRCRFRRRRAAAPPTSRNQFGKGSPGRAMRM